VYLLEIDWWGAVLCFKEPKYIDKRRLFNYYGPAPRTFDARDVQAQRKD
jgi:hypothetical protein